MEYLEAIIGVPEDKEDFVIEVYTEKATFADIERGDRGLSIKIYNNTGHDHWSLDLNQLYKILERAKSELEVKRPQTNSVTDFA